MNRLAGHLRELQAQQSNHLQNMVLLVEVSRLQDAAARLRIASLRRSNSTARLLEAKSGNRHNETIDK
jgi:hypothetical protein